MLANKATGDPPAPASEPVCAAKHRYAGVEKKPHQTIHYLELRPLWVL